MHDYDTPGPSEYVSLAERAKDFITDLLDASPRGLRIHQIRDALDEWHRKPFPQATFHRAMSELRRDHRIHNPDKVSIWKLVD